MNIEEISELPARVPRRRRNSLETLPCGAQKTSISKLSSEKSSRDLPIRTSIFDLYKIGPGPSSSHTIGPMKICNDFLHCVKTELVPTLNLNGKALSVEDAYQLADDDASPASTISSLKSHNRPRFILKCHLHGSLSATGMGHGTHTAVIGGLLGWQPKTCDTDALLALLPNAYVTHEFPVPELGPLRIGYQSIVWHDPEDIEKLYHPNTLLLEILEREDSPRSGTPSPRSTEGADEPGYYTIFEREYYSVGGGFIEKRGGLPEDAHSNAPAYPYSTFNDVLAHLAREPLSLIDLLLKNEETLTGTARSTIFENISEIMQVMDASVERGLAAEGVLPGSINLRRKAATVFRSARQEPTEHLGFLNAYAMAASEENAAGNRVVTAPTSGSAGVIPGLLYFMKHHLQCSEKVRQLSLICGCLIGLLVKHRASISGAEMGCMGEIGVASAMGAAMLTYAKSLVAKEPNWSAQDALIDLKRVEAAAEISLEHHLGMTCDPIEGYVQIPCIQRNSMGAVKAYNSYKLAAASDPWDQKILLDDIIDTVRRTGEDMNAKYKETSQGGLAILNMARSEC